MIGNFKTTASGKFRLVPASLWARLKTVSKGMSGEMYDEIWTENEQIETIRKFGGIFINDKFLPLWDKTTGILILFGGYGSSKTTYAITRQLVKSMENKYHRCFYGRQKKTEARELHSNIITEIKRNGWQDKFDYSEAPNGSPTIICKSNGNRFVMFGCDDEDSLKGIDNPSDILIDEVNQLNFKAFGMLVSRLRKPGVDLQLTCMFNNCDVFPDHWLSKCIFSDEGSENPEDKIVQEALKRMNIFKHHSIYTDNLFQNPESYKAKLELQAGGDVLRIKAILEGEWGVLAGAQPYYKDFDKKKHVATCVIDGATGYNPNLPLYASFDENSNPYLPCLIAQIWGTDIYIIDEITAVSPNNKIEWVCNEITLRYPNHSAGIIVCGDATSKKEDTTTEAGKNWFILIMGYLESMHPSLRVPSVNPNNAIRGLFINSIFRINYGNLRITISPRCVRTIEDLTYCSEAADGSGKDKSRVTVNGVKGVQRWGHLGDCLDYLVCEIFNKLYALFQTQGKKYAPKSGKRIVRNTSSAPVEQGNMRSNTSSGNNKYLIKRVSKNRIP